MVVGGESEAQEFINSKRSDKALSIPDALLLGFLASYINNIPVYIVPVLPRYEGGLAIVDWQPIKVRGKSRQGWGYFILLSHFIWGYVGDILRVLELLIHLHMSFSVPFVPCGLTQLL